MTYNDKPLSTATWSRKKSASTMLTVHYDDGSTAYFEADRDLVRDDQSLVSAAQSRQITGELPAGTITSVKRVR